MRRLGIIVLSFLCLPLTAKQRVTVYPADSAANTGTAVIVCPGGSYSWLGMKAEGEEAAQWLQANGINAFLLRYRVANVSAYIFGYRVFGLGNRYPKMLTDVENALQQVYETADSMRIDTTKIGVMGFSAGGHLAGSLLALWNSGFLAESLHVTEEEIRQAVSEINFDEAWEKE